MLRLLANGVIALFVLWTLAISIAEFLDITVHFPWLTSEADEIPVHRLQSLKIAILLTFAHYGVLHLFGKNTEYLPIHFLSQFLFYLIVSGGIIFYQNKVATLEYGSLFLLIIVWILTLVAAKPLHRNYFKNKWNDSPFSLLAVTSQIVHLKTLKLYSGTYHYRQSVTLY